MPLTPFQMRILSLLSTNRSEESHVAGATAIHMSEHSPRRSHDLDLFHDHEQAVGEAFAADRELLEREGCQLDLQLSQPGFIRALVIAPGGDRLLIDWAHDSAWRFLPPIRVADAGYVLHPVDLAVNKVLALAGRDEPRDLVDTLYLHERVLPLGALCWAACGKDLGLNPEMLLDLLSRKGKVQKADLERLDLAIPIEPAAAATAFRQALQEAREWTDARSPKEVGALYRKPDNGLFFAPGPGEPYELHLGAQGGVLPMFTDQRALPDQPADREHLESFFDRAVT